MTGETDAQLVARVRRGDRAAAGALAERYLRACRAVALAVTGDESDADDVCQNAFVAAIERIDGCRQPERFGARLMQIVRNRARDPLRARGRPTLSSDGMDIASTRPSQRRADAGSGVGATGAARDARGDGARAGGGLHGAATGAELLRIAVGGLAGMAAEEALGLDWFDFLDEDATPADEPLFQGMGLSAAQKRQIEGIRERREERLEACWEGRLPDILRIMDGRTGRCARCLRRSSRRTSTGGCAS